MTLPWEDNKELIIQLYIRDRRRLVDVRDIMRQHHNFRASVRSYRQHFDRWKVGKYRCRRRQWERPDSPGLGSGNNEMMAVSSTPPPLRHPLSPASSSTTEIFSPAPYPVDPSLSMGPAMGYSFLTQAGRGYGSGGSNKSNNSGNVIGEPYHSPFNDYAQFVSQQPLYGHSPRYPDQGCFHPSVHHSYVGMESAYDHPHMPFPNRRTWSIRNSLSSDSDGHREFEDTSASP